MADRSDGDRLQPSDFRALRRWAERYLRRRFHGIWRGQRALIDDAIQHLLERVVSGKARSHETSDVRAFVVWSRRVLDNFVISEFRRQTRPSWPEPQQVALDPATVVETRQLVARLIRLLRSHVEQEARPHSVRDRLALLDDFLSPSFLGGRARSATDRDYQRKCRGKRLASRAWAELRENPSTTDDLTEVARALGLS